MYLILGLFLLLGSAFAQAKSLLDLVHNTLAAPHQDPVTAVPPGSITEPTTTTSQPQNRDITLGPCKWAIGRKCPDYDIKFYIYTRRNAMDRQYLYIDDTLEKSNLTASNFNPRDSTKILIHGYNSDMFLHPLHQMREEYLAKDSYNIIYVDWSVLSPGPCYISAVHNTRHAGVCVAQLVERLVDTGNTDIHMIGFSLGAHIPNYVAQNLSTYKLSRITGLDPALPLFITAGNNDKLDSSDANFVDVIHTNALVQGKLERCGHADFYMNGGINQPGCNGQKINSFACSHQRAPVYFLESIRSPKGFWGWACSGYISYLLGMCPPTNYLLEAGDNIRQSTRGMFIIDTNDSSPFALGKWTDLPTLGAKQPNRPLAYPPPRQSVDPLLQHIDQFGKLASNFNNLDLMPYIEDPYLNWTYFSQTETAHNENDDSVEEQDVVEFVQKDGPYDTQISSTMSSLNWRDYRRNLSDGFIENSIFQMPYIN